MFPPVLAVLGARQNHQNKNLVGLVINVRDQPALVVADVEDNARPDAIGVTQSLPYILETIPTSRFHDSVPG
jgi:hypothetical protein